MKRYETKFPNISTVFDSLTNDDFDCLIEDVQILQSSQIKQIIKKYSIPIINEKTNLINYLMLLRYEPILVAIYNEIQNLIVQHNSQDIQRLQVIKYDPRFESPPNLTINQSNPPFIFGPISIPIGKNSGKFQFEYLKPNDYNSESLINISFLFLNGISHQFALDCKLNGSPLEVSPDDPYPQPIDVTDLVLINSGDNIFEIQMIDSSQPMMICIQEYTYNDIENIMEKVIGRPVKTDEDFYVYSYKCHHNDSFSLANFISSSLATGEWKCPICSQFIDPFDLKIDRNCNYSENS